MTMGIQTGQQRGRLTELALRAGDHLTDVGSGNRVPQSEASAMWRVRSPRLPARRFSHPSFEPQRTSVEVDSFVDGRGHARRRDCEALG
jgi:hypothetical protein